MELREKGDGSFFCIILSGKYGIILCDMVESPQMTAVLGCLERRQWFY